MKFILGTVLFVLTVLPVVAAPVDHIESTGGVPCSLPPADLLASEKMICSDPDLRKADGDLAKTYFTDVNGRLNEGGVEALNLDHNYWYMSLGGGIDARCGIAASRVVPANLKDYYAARDCLLTELDKRRAAIEALPNEKPAAPYLLSPFERVMLRGTAGKELYLRRLLDKRLSGHDDLAVGLQRSLAAVLTTEQTRHFGWLEGGPFQKFVQSTSLGAGTVVETRYFVYHSQAMLDRSSEGAFVADLATGEISAAMIDPLPTDRPALVIWEKTCATPALKEIDRAQFQRLGADWNAQWNKDAPRQLDEEIIETPCR
jgi:hypothetical protein